MPQGAGFKCYWCEKYIAPSDDEAETAKHAGGYCVSEEVRRCKSDNNER